MTDTTASTGTSTPKRAAAKSVLNESRQIERAALLIGMGSKVTFSRTL